MRRNMPLTLSNQVKRILRSGVLCASLLALSVFATPAMAHKTFLMPEKFAWDDGETVHIALTSSLKYPELQFGAKRDRIAFSSAVVGNHDAGELSFVEAEEYLTASFTPAHKGFAVVAMSSKSRAGEIKPKDADGYFDEIGASADVKQAFSELAGDPPLHRSYSKHAKAFFCIETCSSGQEAGEKPVGQPLEFVTIKGAKNRFILLRGGKKLPGQNVTMFSPGKDDVDLVTDRDGIVTVNAGDAGAIMLMSVWITMPEQADGVYHSDYATLTLNMADL